MIYNGWSTEPFQPSRNKLYLVYVKRLYGVRIVDRFDRLSRKYDPEDILCWMEVPELPCTKRICAHTKCENVFRVGLTGRTNKIYCSQKCQNHTAQIRLRKRLKDSGYYDKPRHTKKRRGDR